MNIQKDQYPPAVIESVWRRVPKTPMRELEENWASVRHHFRNVPKIDEPLPEFITLDLSFVRRSIELAICPSGLKL